MSTLKIRKKSRFSTVAQPHINIRISERRMTHTPDNRVKPLSRKKDARRQRKESGLNWQCVRVLLNAGMSLDDAKHHTREFTKLAAR